MVLTMSQDSLLELHAQGPYASGSMLRILQAVKEDMPNWLFESSGWHSVFVDYEKPFVERLWRQHGEYRISLHRIHPCHPGEPYFHPHPWPQGVWVVSGRYEMGMGYGSGTTSPTISEIKIVSGGDQYEMIDRDAWHYVRPLDDVVMSMMITGKPWNRERPKMPVSQLSSLSHVREEEIFQFFKEIVVKKE